MSNGHTDGVDGITMSTTTNNTLVPDFPPGRELEGAGIPVDAIPSLGSEEEEEEGSLSAPSTLALHADAALDVFTDVAPPIHVSTTFRYPRDSSTLVPAAERRSFGPTEYIYSRCAAPSTTRFEAVLTALLRSPTPVLTYSSGLSAIHAILTYLTPKVISVGDGYHGSHGVLGLYQRLTKCKIVDLDCAADELGVGDLIMLETPVNPTGQAFNIKAFAAKAHSRGAYLMVDSTFAPPPLQEPFSLGADVVMHSGTKYFGGHSDLLCGVVAVKRSAWLPKMLEDRVYLGAVMGGLEGWLGVRSIRTLELRVERQARNAREIVAWLHHALTGGEGEGEGDPSKPTDQTTRTIRSALSSLLPHSSLQSHPSHPDSPWLTTQMPHHAQLSTPVFSMLTRTAAQARALPSHLRYFHHATSLGGVESLIEWRCMSDAGCDRRLLRVSVGVEDGRDLMADLVRGFEMVGGLLGEE